jgi:hypothetical protein
MLSMKTSEIPCIRPDVRQVLGGMHACMTKHARTQLDDETRCRHPCSQR